MLFHPLYRVLSKAMPLAGIAIFCASFVPTVGAQQADASNPSAAVPPVSYRSVFKETSLGVEKDSVDWRKANNDVGRFVRGHMDILKEEEAELAKPMPKPMGDAASMPKPAAPGMPDKSMNAPKPLAAPAHKH